VHWIKCQSDKSRGSVQNFVKKCETRRVNTFELGPAHRQSKDTRADINKTFFFVNYEWDE
jgi:hypothetical protein